LASIGILIRVYAIDTFTAITTIPTFSAGCASVIRGRNKCCDGAG
jgi:hypothetical protein